jgi:hypothetical protein
MTMPGFTAEASLSRTNGCYRISYIFTAGTNQVVPQLPFSCYAFALRYLNNCIQQGTNPEICAYEFEKWVDFCSA